jgi:long-chain acyl-CoA synthetase
MHVAEHARRTPDVPAYVMAGSGEVVSYRQLDERSNQLAQLFRAAGLQRGDQVAVMLDNHPRFLEICWGAHRAGLYYTAISSRLTAGEAAYIVGDCGARVVITSAAHAPGLTGTTPDVERRLVLDGAADGWERYDEAVGAHPATPVPDEAEGVDMLYSSGTTGRPKGVKVPLPEAAMGAEPSAVQFLGQLLYGFSPGMVYLSPAPLYHAAPLRFTMAVLREGGTAVVMEHFDAEELLGLVERHQVTHLQVVPTMFVRLLKLPEEVRQRYDVSSLQAVIHAAAPCPVPVKEQMIEWWGPVIHEYYAGTEGNGFCAIDSEQWLAHRGSVGRALVGELHIVGDDGRELPAGETGTVYFGGGTPFEYHNDPEKTASSYNDAGWSTLGDVGHVDEDGYLYLTDRKAHMIISGGVNVYPQEAENVLATHPAVLDVAVIGVPSEDLGEEVKAVVQPVDDIEVGPALAAELMAFCRSQLAGYKCPRSVDFRDELPRHPTGKLYKRLLRDEYWEAAGAAPAARA